jgi:hypothetical protein
MIRLPESSSRVRASLRLSRSNRGARAKVRGCARPCQQSWCVAASISWRAPLAWDRYAGHHEYKIHATSRINEPHSGPKLPKSEASLASVRRDILDQADST